MENNYSLTPKQKEILNMLRDHCMEIEDDPNRFFKHAYYTGIIVTQFSYWNRYFKHGELKSSKRRAFEKNMLMALQAMIDLPCDLYAEICDCFQSMLFDKEETNDTEDKEND